MLTKDVETMAGAAQGKADICEHYPVKFFIRAIMAGFFIVVATILSNVSAAVLYSTYPQFGKLLGAFLFSIAIVLIVFIGGELFTGNNMTMAMGAYAGTCTWKQVLKVWLVSYIGNFVGAFFLSFLFVKSGASHQILVMPLLSEKLQLRSERHLPGKFHIRSGSSDIFRDRRNWNVREEKNLIFNQRFPL